MRPKTCSIHICIQHLQLCQIIFQRCNFGILLWGFFSLFVCLPCIIGIKYRTFHSGGKVTGPSTGLALLQDLPQGRKGYRTFHRNGKVTGPSTGVERLQGLPQGWQDFTTELHPQTLDIRNNIFHFSQGLKRSQWYTRLASNCQYTCCSLHRLPHRYLIFMPDNNFLFNK